MEMSGISARHIKSGTRHIKDGTRHKCYIPFLRVGVFGITRCWHFALSRLWFLNKGAILFVKLTQHANCRGFLDHAAALSTTTSITRSLTTGPCVRESGGRGVCCRLEKLGLMGLMGVDSEIILIARMTTESRRASRSRGYGHMAAAHRSGNCRLNCDCHDCGGCSTQLMGLD